MSRLIFDNFIDARALLSTNREVLGYFLLEHLHALGGGQQHRHPGNLASSIASHYPPPFRDEIQKFVFSACKWLVLREYLVEINNQGFFEMSALGKRMTEAADHLPDFDQAQEGSSSGSAVVQTDAVENSTLDSMPTLTSSKQAFHESATLASWVFGGLILIFLMLIVFVDFDKSKFPIIRFFMALSAGFFAIFFVGGILLKGTLNGLLISATGGFVLFVLIQFVVDPFKVLPTPASSKPVPDFASPSPAATTTPKLNINMPFSAEKNVVASGPGNTPTIERNNVEEIEIRATLRDADALIQAGSMADKEKALQLYISAVKRLKLSHRRLDEQLLKGAEYDYGHHFDDNARSKYKALLEAYLRDNSTR